MGLYNKIENGSWQTMKKNEREGRNIPHIITPMPPPLAVLGGPHLHPTTDDPQLLLFFCLWLDHLFIIPIYQKDQTRHVRELT